MIEIAAERCVGCGACVPVCPNEAISLPETMVATIDQTRCTGCEACVDVCPSDAILVIDIIEPEPAALKTQPNTALTVQTVAWPAIIGSALVWTGREFLPRLAASVIDKLARRPKTAPEKIAFTQREGGGMGMGRGRGKGKHRRQRPGRRRNGI